MTGAWALTDWLVDASALARLGTSPDAAAGVDRIDRGLVRICTVTRLEIGYSARSGAALRAATHRPPLASMPVEYQTPAGEDRAAEVQTLLADRGRHRAASVPDLIVAAGRRASQGRDSSARRVPGAAAGTRREAWRCGGHQP